MLNWVDSIAPEVFRLDLAPVEEPTIDRSGIPSIHRVEMEFWRIPPHPDRTWKGHLAERYESIRSEVNRTANHPNLLLRLNLVYL